MSQCLASSFYRTVDAIWYLGYLASCCFCVCFNREGKL